jgi:hypothetical protein
MTADLRPAIVALFGELRDAKVDYLLVGDVALLAYVEGRNTQDIDLIVSPKDVARLGWRARLKDDDFGEATYRGVSVDLLLRKNPLFDAVAREERTTLTFAGMSVPAATRDGLLLLKLYALPSLYRRGHLARAALYETDILMLHQGAEVDDERLLARLSPYLPSHDVSELRRILDEQRGRKRFG